MGSSSAEEGANKPFSLYDPPSPSNQPLLSKANYPSPSISEPEQESDATQYLQISFNYGPRPFKDLPFLIRFLLLVVATFGFGFFSVFHRNNNYSSISAFKYDSYSSSCVKDSGFLTSRGLNSLRGNHLLLNLIWVLVITLILSLPICFLLLLCLKRYTKHLVYAALPLFVLIPVFFNVYWFVACTVSSKCSDAIPLVYRILVLVFVFLIIAVVVWIFVVNWHRIELTINIIGVASDALSKNLGLFVALPLMTFGLVVYYAPIVVFLVYARFNGNIVPRELNGSYSCVWKQDGWVPAYYALGIITMLWSLAAMVEAQVYVISGTVAQWYFAKDEAARKRAIRSSLRHAFGPSFGTVCLSGMLICVVRLVRAAVDSARQGEAQGMVNIVLRGFVNIFLSAIEFLNKFTVNFASITGESYCSSARMTYELLKRNLLSPVFVETISTRLLAGIVIVLSAIYAIVVCAILKGVSKLGVDSYFVAALAWVLLVVVLGFFVHVLENVIETVYICYAIDRDRGEVCKQDVHDVYVQLPISRNHRSVLPTRTLV